MHLYFFAFMWFCMDCSPLFFIACCIVCELPFQLSSNCSTLAWLHILGFCGLHEEFYFGKDLENGWPRHITLLQSLPLFSWCLQVFFYCMVLVGWQLLSITFDRFLGMTSHCLYKNRFASQCCHIMLWKLFVFLFFWGRMVLWVRSGSVLCLKLLSLRRQSKSQWRLWRPWRPWNL